MKTDRLMGILAILSRQKKTTAPALAERFEVSRRTILRDLDALCRAGIPIVTVQGYDGGISLALPWGKKVGAPEDSSSATRRPTRRVVRAGRWRCVTVQLASRWRCVAGLRRSA